MREICCLFQIILETISDLRRIAGYIYTFVLGLISSRVNLGGTGPGRRKLVGRMQASDREEGSASPQICPGFQVAVGISVQSLGSLASSGSSDAAGHSQAMAHHGLPSVLAQEIKRTRGPTRGSTADAKSDSSAQPRESLMGCPTNRGYSATSRLRSAVQRHHS